MKFTDHGSMCIFSCSMDNVLSVLEPSEIERTHLIRSAFTYRCPFPGCCPWFGKLGLCMTRISFSLVTLMTAGRRSKTSPSGKCTCFPSGKQHEFQSHWLHTYKHYVRGHGPKLRTVEFYRCAPEATPSRPAG
jgi:hypothetical protein